MNKLSVLVTAVRHLVPAFGARRTTQIRKRANDVLVEARLNFAERGAGNEIDVYIEDDLDEEAFHLLEREGHGVVQVGAQGRHLRLVVRDEPSTGIFA